MLLPALFLLLAGASPPRHEVAVHAVYPLPRWGVALGYRYALRERLGVGTTFEYVMPSRGYLHLPGFEEAVGLSLWLREVGHGLYVEPQLSFAHSVFYRLPEQSRHVMRLGGEAGWRLALSRRWSVGVGMGAAYGWSIGPQGSICTFDFQCASTRPGAVPRARVSVGVRW